MIEDVFALPESGEAEYLIDGLGRLIQLRGHEHFVAAPLLLPEPRFWPDPVEARGNAAATLLRRLLAYAGLGHLGVDVEIGAERARVHHDHPMDADPDGERHAAGWFLGIEQDVCHFGMSNSMLRDEETLIGTLGHEVAHAYRDFHGLMVRSRDLEEQLTDLTTVYLGFGFFTLQSSFQFKTGHYDEHGQRLLFERQALGYLTPGQLAFLLAAQLAVRAQGQQELAQMLKILAPNHADALKRAHRELYARRDDLLPSLELPSEESWPAPYDLVELTQPLGAATVRVVDRAEHERERLKERKIAFRVRSDFSVLGGAAGAMLGFWSFLIEGVGLWMWVLTPALGVAGYRLGRHIDSARCTSCDHRVQLTATACSFCDTRLVGTIANADARLEAEEEYWSTLEHSDTPSSAPAPQTSSQG